MALARPNTHTKKSRKIPENPGKFQIIPVVNNAHTSSTVKSVIQQTSHLYGWLIRKIDECVDMHTWMKNTLKAVSENPGKSRKIPEIPENSENFRKIPDTRASVRAKSRKPPANLGKIRRLKLQLINREIPENPGKSRKILETRIRENPGKSLQISGNYNSQQM